MLHHMATILVCYGGHFEPKMAAKIQKSSDFGGIWFPSRLWCSELIFIVWEPYDIISCCVCSVSYYVPQAKFQETYCGLLCFLLSPQTKFRYLLFLHRFLLLLLLLLLWTYVKIFDLTYIGNCQRDFHKTWHIY